MLLLGLIGFLWLYQYAGLKHYIKAVREINQLEGEEKTEALEHFSAEPGWYSGTLAGVNTRGYGGVWVWGRQGLKYFKTDENSAYAFFEMCRPENLGKLEKNEKGLYIGQDIETDIGIWAEKTRQGDYTVLSISGAAHGGTPGRARQVWAHDWPAFAPADIREECEKR